MKKNSTTQSLGIAVLIGILVGSVALFSMKEQYKPIQDTQPVSTQNAVPSTSSVSFANETRKQSSEQILEQLDRMAGHPMDGTLPAHIKGLSDDEIASIPPKTAVELMKASQAALTSSSAHPRHYLAMARLTFQHGNYASALKFLQTAAGKGSAVAHAYLGDIAADNGDREMAFGHFNKALKGGHLPAQEALDFFLAQIEEEQAQLQAEERVREEEKERRRTMLASFARPNLIRDLEQGKSNVFNHLVEFTYLKALNQKLEDASAVYKSSGITPMVDLKIGAYLNYIEMSPNFNKERAEMQIEQGLKGLKQTGQVFQILFNSTHGKAIDFNSLFDPQKMTKTMVDLMNTENEKMRELARGKHGQKIAAEKDGEKDGEMMLQLINYYPEKFQTIYFGLKTVVKKLGNS